MVIKHRSTAGYFECTKIMFRRKVFELRTQYYLTNSTEPSLLTHTERLGMLKYKFSIHLIV